MTEFRVTSGRFIAATFSVCILLLPNLVCGATAATTGQVIQSEGAAFQIEVVAEGLQIPWSLTFLPDGTALLGERERGRLSILDINSGALTEISGLPEMLRDREISSGLFDIKAHPDFSNNRLLYVVHGVGTATANGLALSRLRLQDNRLVDAERLFESAHRIAGKWHFGGRLALHGGYLYLSTGDGYDFSALSQDLSSHAGKILRLHDDGQVPNDNPFVSVANALPEIWAYGVRNPQGMAMHPVTGEIWFNEHGPQGGDEVNIARAGSNFGWPVITYGEEYGGGPIGDGITQHSGMEQPRYYWRPSIAPSGMTFYAGDSFPGWRNSIFIGALALTHLNRLVVADDRIIHEERLLSEQSWRIRFVEEGPDGLLYIGNDHGQILRLRPVH